ncbi:hypothetical protein LCI18_010858 [Fusarium solani-melongenae]|uniref:Uncharacterized protein n=1 Tax=Fusarium solani subsp. cucurbitae TaxID=2747967 RepID=A0ACD3ZF34_FUSSC|nr:hypothetical protein LCI18_010858 [Fusarium solani-melongenae]
MSSYCFTECPPPQQAWYKDEALYEFTSSDLFWLLAIAIMVNCWWVNKQFEPSVEPSSDPKEPEKAEKEPEKAEKEPEKAGKEAHKVLNEPDSTEPLKSPASQHVWLKSQITSEPRRFLAMTICALVFPVQLLHGSWVLKTLWRWTAGLLKATYPSIRPRLFGFILYSPITLFILVTWIAGLFTGLYFICGQFLCLLNINEMKLSVPSKASEKVAQQVGDEEWDEVEKNSEQGEVGKEKNKAKLAD